MTKSKGPQGFITKSRLFVIWLSLFIAFILLAAIAGNGKVRQWISAKPVNYQLDTQVEAIVNSFPHALLTAVNQKSAQFFIDAIQGEVSDKAYFLYRMQDSRLVLHAQSAPLEGYVPSPIMANHTANLTNWIEIRRVLQRNNENIGLLIAAAHKPKIDLQLLLTVITASLIASLLLTRMISALLNRTVSECLQPLMSDADKITKKARFEKRLAAAKYGPLSKLATMFNALYKQVSQTTKQNQQLEHLNLQLADDMESKINERTNALRKAMEEAEQANESKSTFLATMSHEIRTPMNGIIGSIDLLRNSQLNQNQFRLSDTIRESAFSLLRIIDDILDFSKIEAGKLEVESIPMSINEIIEAVGRTLLSVAQQKKIQLRLYCDPAIHDGLMGDPIRVRQILFNLAGNAIKFTQTSSDKQGIVQIRADIADTNMEFTNVVLKVIDNGKGMTERQVNYVFQPFNQAEGSVTRHFGGTGLGLTICQRLTDLMYGQIQVRSQLGKGSEFSVALPLRSSLDKAFIKTHNFKSMAVICYSNDNAHLMAIGQYCQFHGAKVTQLESLEKLQQLKAHYRVDSSSSPIWILDATGNRREVLRLLEQLLTVGTFNSVKFLILGNNLDTQVIEDERVWYAHAMPLCRSSLLETLDDIMLNIRPLAAHKVERRQQDTGALSIEQAKAQNQLVLLAEDNSMNQQVITEQLNMLGYAVEVANDGQEAIDMWYAYPYPLVLTDLHMPNKSGYDLVQAIRESERDNSKPSRTRVIAITANALKGEEQKCIDLGMDGYLTKPLELNDLEIVMNKWLNVDEPTADGKAKVVTLATQQEEDRQPIRQDMLVGYLGQDIKRHHKYLNMFKQKGQTLLDSIATHIEQNEREEVRDLAHQLKSMAKSVGAIPLSAVAAEMQLLPLTVELAKLKVTYRELREQFELVATYINRNFPTIGANSNKNASGSAGV